MVTRWHSLSLVVPLVVIPYHSLSLFVIRCHSLYHSLSFAVTRCTTRCHSLSLDEPLVCLFINNPPWMFSKSCNFLQMIFGWEQSEEQQHYKNLKQIRYFTILNIAECWCTSEDSVIIQSWSTQFPVATFSQRALFGSCATCILLCLCDAWNDRSYVNVNVSFSSIFNNDQFYLKYYYLGHRNSHLKWFS